MPYIITTTTYQPGSPMPSGRSRRAVATLDEARRRATGPIYAARIACQINGGQEAALYEEAEAIPDTGGTIGPLPDGTVVEVRRVMFPEIMRGAGLSRRDTPMMSDRAIIDAFNEATA